MRSGGHLFQRVEKKHGYRIASGVLDLLAIRGRYFSKIYVGLKPDGSSSFVHFGDEPILKTQRLNSI